jgi:hypothetical protein
MLINNGKNIRTIKNKLPAITEDVMLIHARVIS